MPSVFPEELKVLILRYSGHVRLGHRSISYTLYIPR